MTIQPILCLWIGNNVNTLFIFFPLCPGRIPPPSTAPKETHQPLLNLFSATPSSALLPGLSFTHFIEGRLCVKCNNLTSCHQTDCQTQGNSAKRIFSEGNGLARKRFDEKEESEAGSLYRNPGILYRHGRVGMGLQFIRIPSSSTGMLV